MTHMAGLVALCLLLGFPLSSSQSTLQSEQGINAHQAPAAAPHIRDLLSKEETTHLNAKRTCKSFHILPVLILEQATKMCHIDTCKVFF